MDIHFKRRLPLLFLPLFLFIFSLLPSGGLRAEGYELLRPDTGGHRSTIGAPSATPDGRYLLSAARDKTLRVWDLGRKKQERLIPGVIGGNGYGYLYDLFLSRSGKYLISAGLFGTPFSSGYNFRCIDFETGDTIFAYGTGLHHLQSYALNADDSCLAAGFSDGTLMLFDFGKMAAAGKRKALLHYTKSKPFLFFDHPDKETACFPPYRQINTAKNSGGNAGFLEVGFFDAERGLVCTVNGDSRITLFNRKTGDLTEEVRYQGITAAAFSAGRLAIVHRGDGPGSSVTVLEPAGGGKLRESVSVSLENPYTEAAFSRDGSRLLLCSASGNGAIVGLSAGSDSSGPPSASTPGKTTFSLPYEISAACWTGPNEIALADAGSYAIHGYDFLAERETFLLQSEAAPVWAVAARDTEIAFGRVGYRHINEKTSLEQVFDLTDFSFSEVTDPEGFQRIGTKYENLEVYWENHPDKGEVIVVSQNGDPVRHVSRGRQIGASVWCYGITEDGFVLSGGYSGALHASWLGREYDDGNVPEGMSWRHDAPLTAIAESATYIVTAGKDGVIHLYSREELNREFEQSFRRSKGSSTGAAVGLTPAVSMIVTPDGEYCLWTPDGYYACSEKGFGLLYWQKNLREGITPEIYSFGEHKPENNRPDIIRERLGIGE